MNRFLLIAGILLAMAFTAQESEAGILFGRRRGIRAQRPGCRQLFWRRRSRRTSPTSCQPLSTSPCRPSPMPIGISAPPALDSPSDSVPEVGGDSVIDHGPVHGDSAVTDDESDDTGVYVIDYTDVD